MSELTYDQILGALITYNRDLAGVTVNQLAEAFDLKYQHIWDLENGQRPVSRKRLRAIIAVLKTTPEAFWQNLPLALKKLNERIQAKSLLN